MGAAARSAPALLQSVNEIGARTLQRGINPHRNSGQDRQRDGEQKHWHRKFETGRRIEREKVRRHFRNDGNELPREQRAQGAGDCADEQTFGQE